MTTYKIAIKANVSNSRCDLIAMVKEPRQVFGMSLADAVQIAKELQQYRSASYESAYKFILHPRTYLEIVEVSNERGVLAQACLAGDVEAGKLLAQLILAD